MVLTVGKEDFKALILIPDEDSRAPDEVGTESESGMLFMRTSRIAISCWSSATRSLMRE